MRVLLPLLQLLVLLRRCQTGLSVCSWTLLCFGTTLTSSQPVDSVRMAASTYCTGFLLASGFSAYGSTYCMGFLPASGFSAYGSTYCTGFLPASGFSAYGSTYCIGFLPASGFSAYGRTYCIGFLPASGFSMCRCIRNKNVVEKRL